MGDSVDNIKGVPGHRREGRARTHLARTASLDALLAAAPTIAQKRYREALHRARRRRRGRAASSRASAPTCRSRSTRTRCATAGPSRERCYALFSSLGFRTLVAEFAPTAATSHARLRASSASLAERRRARRGDSRRPAQSASASIATGRRPCARDVVGLVVLGQPGDGALRARWRTPGSPRRRTCRAARRVRHGWRRSLADAGDREGRPRPEVRRRSPARARGIALAGVDIDTMVASYLLDATALEPRARRPGARARRLPRASPQRTSRARAPRRCRSTPCRPASLLAFAGERADLPLSLGAGPASTSCVAKGLERVYRDLEQPLIPVLADIERAGVKVDTAGARRARAQRCRPQLDELSRRDLRAGRRRVQHQLAEAARAKCCSSG